MRRKKEFGIGVLAIGVVVANLVVRSPAQTSKPSHAVTKQQFEQWKKDLSTL
jgi:hypothetical protein